MVNARILFGQNGGSVLDPNKVTKWRLKIKALTPNHECFVSVGVCSKGVIETRSNAQFISYYNSVAFGPNGYDFKSTKSIRTAKYWALDDEIECTFKDYNLYCTVNGFDHHQFGKDED